MVIRRNQKTVTMVTDENHQWNVAPGLLRKVEGGAAFDIPVSLALMEGRKALGQKKP